LKFRNKASNRFNGYLIGGILLDFRICINYFQKNILIKEKL